MILCSLVLAPQAVPEQWQVLAGPWLQRSSKLEHGGLQHCLEERLARIEPVAAVIAFESPQKFEGVFAEPGMDLRGRGLGRYRFSWELSRCHALIVKRLRRGSAKMPPISSGSALESHDSEFASDRVQCGVASRVLFRPRR